MNINVKNTERTSPDGAVLPKYNMPQSKQAEPFRSASLDSKSGSIYGKESAEHIKIRGQDDPEAMTDDMVN